MSEWVHSSYMRVSIYSTGGIINTCGDLRRNKKFVDGARDAGAFSRRRHRHGTQVRKREGTTDSTEGKTDGRGTGLIEKMCGWVGGWLGERRENETRKKGREDGRRGRREERKNQINRRTWRIRGWSAREKDRGETKGRRGEREYKKEGGQIEEKKERERRKGRAVGESVRAARDEERGWQKLPDVLLTAEV